MFLLDRVGERLRKPLSRVADMLGDAGLDVPACTDFPVAHWLKLRSNNPLEWLR